MKIPFLDGENLLSSFGGSKGGNIWVPILGALMLLCFLISGYLLYTANAATQNSVQYLENITQKKLLSQQIVPNAQSVVLGNKKASGALAEQQEEFNAALKTLFVGESGLPALDSKYNAELSNIKSKWLQYSESLGAITDSVGEVGRISSDLRFLRGTYFNNVKKDLGTLGQFYQKRGNLPVYSKINETSQLVADAVESLNVLDRSDASGVKPAVNGFVKHYAGYLRNINTLPTIKGSDKDASVKADRHLKTMANKARVYLDDLQKDIPVMEKVRLADKGLAGISQSTLQAVESLEDSVRADTSGNEKNSLLGTIAGLLGLLAMCLLGYLLIKSSREREAVASETNRSNQNSILRLLDEMSSLAEGDLTVQATVTEDITGAIADSVNFSIDALRSMVSTIDTTAAEVSSSSQETQQVVSRLRDASTQQKDELTTATSSIVNMADSMKTISASAQNKLARL